MRAAILDTHVFIWMDAEPTRVSPTVLGDLRDPNCMIYLSVVSVWEIIVKVRKGKLQLRADVEQIVAEQQKTNPLALLPLTYDHALANRSLPLLHKDPFDRMLVAQAVAENAILLTDDRLIRQYPVQTDW
jgi:PIN domain nuclease of toxin-antitoxin system